MGCNCNNFDGNGPPRAVTISDIRMDLNDTVEPYSMSDEMIQKAINDATIVARVEYDICIDPKLNLPCTDLDAYIIEQLAVIRLLRNHLIQIHGGSSMIGSADGQTGGQCSGASYNAFIDSISEGGSSISFSSMGDIQSIIDAKLEELEKLKIGRWGCALELSFGNY